MAGRLAGDLGQLVVSVGTDLSDLNKGLKSADSEIKGFTKGAESSLLSFKNIAIGAAAAAASAIVALGVQTFKYGQELHKLSVQTGISAKDLAQLKFIADQVDSSFESLVGSIKFISRSMYEASTGNKELAEAYKKLGINITNADGSLRDAKDILFELGPATQKLGNETEALAILMKLTGRSAQELQGFMKTSKEEMDNLRETNIHANENLNEFVEVVDRLSDRMGFLNESFKNFAAESSLPFLRWLDNTTSNTRNLSEALKKLQEYMFAFGSGGIGGLAAKFGQDLSFNALKNNQSVGFLPAQLPGREGPQIAGTPGFIPSSAGSRLGPETMARPFSSKYGVGKGQQAPAGFSEGGGEDILGINFGAITAKMEELKTKWKDISAQMAESFGSSMEMITKGFGDGVANMIVEGDNFGESMKQLFKDFAKEAISQIVAIIAQQVILFAWQVVTGTVGSGNLMPNMGGSGKKKFFGLFRDGGLMPQARDGIMTGGYGESGIPVMAHPNEIIAPIDKVFNMMQEAMGRGATYNVYPSAGMDERSLAQKVALENERRKRRP